MWNVSRDKNVARVTYHRLDDDFVYCAGDAANTPAEMILRWLVDFDQVEFGKDILTDGTFIVAFQANPGGRS